MPVRSTLVPFVLSAVALICGCLAPAPCSLGVVDGVIPACNDTRFDCVGLLLVKTNDEAVCPSYFIAGSCTLIAPDLIVTAHHCVAPEFFASGASFAPSQLRVRFRRGPTGEANSEFRAGNLPGDCSQVGYQEIDVVEVQVAPYGVPSIYEEDTTMQGPDLALLRLAAPVQMVKPVKLGNFPSQGAALAVAGWGYSGECYCQGDRWGLRWGPSIVPLTQWDYYYGISYGGYTHFFTPCFDGVTPAQAPYHICTETFNSFCPQNAPQSSTQCPRDWPGGASANVHDSGGPIFQMRTCAGGAEELRLVGVINSRYTCVQVMSWNDFRTEGQIVLPDPPSGCGGCGADVTGDGALSMVDVFGYLQLWFGGVCMADWDRSGGLGTDDIMAYLNAWFAGCD